jgi:hypothetical protein
VLAGVLAAMLLGAIEWSALNDWVPRLARPFVVGAAFVAGVAAMEPRRIRHELGYLRRQLALGPADDSTV